VPDNRYHTHHLNIVHLKFTLSIPILFEDNHLLVVDKPAGIPVQADGKAPDDLLNRLKAYIKSTYGKPGDVFLGLVHRLDQPVSGVMVFARTSKAASRLSEQIRLHQMKKTYRARLSGRLTVAEGTLRHYLWKDDKTNTVKVYEKPGRDTKESVLHFRLMAEEKGDSIVEIDLVTGRPHQIRAQFAHIGHPLRGDGKYGSSDGSDLALRAVRLGLFHPVTKEWMEFSVGG
jgi:23S rRNA pseudouridine1911/1915/1917 synthase